MTLDTADSSEEDLRIIRVLLAGTNPAPSQTATRAEQRQGRRLFRELAAAQPVPRRAGRPAAVRRRLVATGAALAAAVTVGLLGVTVIDGGSAAASPLLPTPLTTATSGDHEAAVEVLLDAARQQRELVVPGTGPVRYTLSQVYGLEVTVARPDPTTTAVTRLIHSWRRPDGSGHVEQFLQEVDRAGHPVGGPTPPDSPAQRRFDTPAVPAERDVALLPVDPDQLYRQLLALDPAGTASAMVFGFLRDGGTSPRQNAALYEVLARDGAVFDAGPVTDRAGRAGRSVGIQFGSSTGPFTVTSYVVVGGDGTPLGVENVFSPDPPPALGLPPGPTVAEYVQFSAERLVPAVGETN